VDITPVIPRRSVVDACADALRDAIMSGRIATGERLPPERALAEQLGVNRVTLRGALSRLASEGLLAARQGSGHTVLDYRHLGGPELVGTLFAAATGDALLALAGDVLEVRRALARVVFGHVAQASKAALAPVLAAIAAFEALPSDAREDDIASADLAIVRALLDATGRPALPLFWNPVATIVRTTPRLRAAMYADVRANTRGWAALGQWLATPRRERAKLDDTLGLLDQLLHKRDQLVLEHLRRNP